jgi:hypothetical protein
MPWERVKCAFGSTGPGESAAVRELSVYRAIREGRKILFGG